MENSRDFFVGRWSEGCFGRPEGHKYASKTCPKCDGVFCWECCKDTNVHEGGKYAPDYMECPHCGHDYYSD